MMKNNLSEQEIVEAFSSICEAQGSKPKKPEGLLVPYFHEFNRLMEHRELNRMVNTPFNNLVEKGWYQNTVSARINDMRKVDSGWHSTAFEMLVEVIANSPEKLNQSYKELTLDIRRFLIDSLKLDINNLEITYFGGGQILSGISLEEDIDLKEAWLEIGIKEKNLFPILGPKNYILMVGERERCGPTCELIYNFKLQNGLTKQLEIGTVIFNSHRVRFNSSKGIWSIEKAPSIISGVAYGLGRLVCSIHKKSLQDTILHEPLKLIRQYTNVPEKTIQLLQGDMIVLADQLRAVMFLMAFGVKLDESTQGKTTKSILRRCRRKIDVLNISELKNFITEFEAIILAQYKKRFPELESVRGELLKEIEKVAWPTGWNPDSYDKTKL